MFDQPPDAFKKRQAQWDAFHHWESSRDDLPLSLEERVGWYCAASRFSLALSPKAGPEFIQTKVKDIQEVRARLAQLKRAPRHG